MMNEFSPKRSLAEEVATHLRGQIGKGIYKAGSQLPTEPELMKQLGVGRSSIREAIRILANSGLLRVQQGSGTFVEEQDGIMEPLAQRLRRSEADDIDEVRQLLEMKIAEKAALHRTEKDLQKIKTALDKRAKAARAGSVEQSIQADIDFHVSIAHAAKNDILADLYQSFAAHMKKSFSQRYPDTSPFINTLSLHEDLYESIRAGDEKKAWKIASRIVHH